MTTTAEILQKARGLISDEKNWTQCDMAKDEAGNSVDALGPLAMCFCSLGAIHRATGGGFSSAEMSARDALRKVLTGGHSIASFNDTHRHAEVLSLFDRAIKRAISAEVAL